MKKEHELDRKFDKNQEDILHHFDLNSAKQVNIQQKKINIDMPQWMIEALDREAAILGIARQAIIKTWISDRLRSSQNKIND